MQEKIIGKSFEDMQLEDMEKVFGGSNEVIQPRATPTIVLTPAITISAAGVSAIGGIVSYNKECLG